MSYNKSYADTTISGTNGKSYRYGDVFVETTTREAGVGCGTTNCYIGCSCNTSNGWYASCQGTDCQSVTDTRYTGVNSLSASGAVEGGILGKSGLSTQSSTKGNTQIISLDSGISTMSSGATTCYKVIDETPSCPDGYYEDVPDSSANNYINFSTSNGCYKPISCKPGYYPNRAFYDQLESPVATYKNLTCFPARYFVDFGCPMLNNDFECADGEGWHIVGRSYHTNTGEPLPGSVTITISGSKGCDGSITYTDSDFPGTNSVDDQKCYYKTGCTDVIGAKYTAKTSDPRVEVIMDCSENSDFECPAGYSSEKPDDRYFVYNTEDWNNTATGKVTTCYNTTGCKEGYTQYDNGTTGYTSTDGFVCYKNSSCDNSNGWYSDMPDDIYFNYETQDLGDGLYCYRVTGCNADNGYIADDNGYISWHNVKCGDDTCPDGWYFDIPNNRDVFEYETGPSKVLQMPDWCYRITGCKDGYTSVNNGTTPIVDTPSGFKCYTNGKANTYRITAHTVSHGYLDKQGIGDIYTDRVYSVSTTDSNVKSVRITFNSVERETHDFTSGSEKISYTSVSLSDVTLNQKVSVEKDNVTYRTNSAVTSTSWNKYKSMSIYINDVQIPMASNPFYTYGNTPNDKTYTVDGAKYTIIVSHTEETTDTGSNCPDGYYLDFPGSAFKYVQTTGSNGDICYKVTGCASGYTNTPNDNQYALYNPTAGVEFKCYKDTPVTDWYVQAYLTSKGSGTSAQCCLRTSCYNGGQHPRYANGVVIRLLNDSNATILSARNTCENASDTETCYALSYLPAGQTCGGGSDIRVVVDDANPLSPEIYQPDDILTDNYGNKYKLKFNSAPITKCPDGYEEGSFGNLACKFKTMTLSGGQSCIKYTGCNTGYTTVDNGTTPVSCGQSIKCYKEKEEGCPDGYYEPIENATGWSMIKTFMQLEEKNGCYKPISCKSGYFAKSDLKSGYDKYFQLDYSANFGGLSCYTGHCKYSTPNTSYFTTSEFDVGGGIKCKYATGCRSTVFNASGQKPYRYSSSDDTSGCDSYHDVQTSGNITCYQNIYYDDIITVTLVMDRYINGNYTDYSVKSTCPYPTSFQLSFFTGVDTYSTQPNHSMQCNRLYSMVKKVDGVQSGHITSVQPKESQTALSNCGLYSYDFGSAAGGKRSYIVKYNYEVNDFH